MKNETHTNFISYTHVLQIADEHALKNLGENVGKVLELRNYWNSRKSIKKELSDEIFINKVGRYEVNFHTQFYQTTLSNVKIVSS